MWTKCLAHTAWTFPVREIKQKKMETVKDAERSLIDRERQTERQREGVGVERIYEWLSVGYGPSPSVVHSSVMFTTPPAPMCLPVAHTHVHTPSHTHTCLYCSNAYIDMQKESHYCTVTITPMQCHWAANISFVIPLNSTSRCVHLTQCARTGSRRAPQNHSTFN